MFLIKKLHRKIILLILFVLFFCYQTFCQSNQIDGFEIPRLSPRPATVANVQHSQISLNGKWDFQVEDPNAKHTINVPGEWEMQGFTVNEGKTAIYNRELEIPADWKGKRIKIQFDGVSSHALYL